MALSSSDQEAVIEGTDILDGEGQLEKLVDAVCGVHDAGFSANRWSGLRWLWRRRNGIISHGASLCPGSSPDPSGSSKASRGKGQNSFSLNFDTHTQWIEVNAECRHAYFDTSNRVSQKDLFTFTAVRPGKTQHCSSFHQTYIFKPTLTSVALVLGMLKNNFNFLRREQFPEKNYFP